jgi:hypothetical protein
VLNRDGTPQHDEIGPSSTRSSAPSPATLDPNLRREKNWAYELTVDRELRSGVRIGAGYYRRRFFDFA